MGGKGQRDDLSSILDRQVNVLAWKLDTPLVQTKHGYSRTHIIGNFAFARETGNQ